MLCSEPDALPDGLRCPVYAAPQELVSYASPVKNSPGPVFSLAMPQLRALASDAALRRERGETVLDGLKLLGEALASDVGTLIRTANALGVDAVILAGGCADHTSPRAVRASMGAAFRQYVVECAVSELAGLMEDFGLTLYGTALDEGAADIRTVDLSGAAIAIGNEGHGLSAALLSACRGRLIIPMRPGSESLNAAAAGALVMWEMVHKRL